MRDKLNRRDVLLGTGAAGLTVLAGCTGGQSTPAPTEEPTSGGGGGGSTDAPTETGTPTGSSGRELMQGVLLPTTGDLASVGQPIQQGALLPGVQLEGEIPYTLDIQTADTQTDPQAGISAANNLVNAGYPAVTGPASSGVNIAVSQQVFIPNQVVGCSPSSTSPNVTTLEDNDFIFRTPPSDALQGQVIAQVGSEQLEAGTASTMFVNNDYGQALSDSFVDSFSGEVAETVSFEKQQSSYTAKLNQAMSSNPDMLVVIGYPESGIQLFRDFYADYDPGQTDIVVTDGLKDPALPGEVGTNMSNVIGTAPTAAGPGAEFFSELFEDEYGAAPGVFTSQAYDATAVCLLANAAGGENSGTAVRDNMRTVANPEGEQFGPESLAEAFEAVAAGDQINYAGASSSVDFDENGDMRSVTYEVFGFTEDGVETQSTIEFSG
jgi:ABC-type branched-subunit amino acid transport system substrate-binding protein